MVHSMLRFDMRSPHTGAPASELARLPRIGAVLAARIVAQRDEHGPFSSRADKRSSRVILSSACTAGCVRIGSWREPRMC